jgi:hypothetical protein
MRPRLAGDGIPIHVSLVPGPLVFTFSRHDCLLLSRMPQDMAR